MDKQLEHSPKLKMARLEIEAILTKYDIGAAVMIHEPGFTEMILKVDPSYSCAYMDGKNFKVRPPLVDPTDESKHKKVIAETVNFLANMRLRLGQYAIAFTQAEMMVRQEFNIQAPPQKKQIPPGINNNHKKN